jgi:putative glutamine amidotransferase
MKHKPVIGITMDAEQAGGYSKMPWYALRQNYFESIVAAGGIPIALPHHASLVDDYLQLIDGLLITGGAFDIAPSLYGMDNQHPTVTTKDTRTEFEWAMTLAMHQIKKPILGICGGEQLLAVVLGGTLIQHIPDAVPGALAHEQPNPRTEAGHSVMVHPDTLLHRLTNQEVLAVNSAHHQAVDTLPPTLKINAVAADGVIEGIEDPAHPFCLGVQWHPEYIISEGDKRIFEGFVHACHL